MKPLTKLIVILNLLLLFAYLGYSTWQKENLLSEGRLILLELAPVDPRSLMQGDYMTLNYAIANTVRQSHNSKRGFLVVTLDERGVGQFARVQDHPTPVAAGEYVLNYQKKQRGVDIGAGSFFFQEGRANDYDKAKYGAIRIDNEGNTLLEGLYDVDLQEIN